LSVRFWTMAPRSDPYATLGVKPGASDDEVRAAYRRLVQLHHPDHNGGSADSARRFEEVQEAYARVRDLRAGMRPRPGPGPDPDLDSRLADLERELARARAAADRVAKAAQAQRERQAAHERARRAARASQAGGSSRERPSDEELGYFKTDDSFSKILSDAASELADRLSGAASDAADKMSGGVRKQRVADRVADLLDELGSKLNHEPPG